MTKVLFTSDWHVDAVTAGVSRNEELVEYIAGLVRYVETHSVDVVCFCGDAFDPGSMREGQWSGFMFDALHRITHATEKGSVWITGNHDVIDSSIVSSTLTPLALAMNQYGATYWGEYGKAATVCEMPELVPFHGKFAVLALPYVARVVERTDAYRSSFRTVLESAAQLKSEGWKVVAIGHYALPGVVPDSEEQMMRGREIPIPALALRDLGLDLVVNGHYHARQTIVVDDLRVEVVGAPARFTFGEASDGVRGFLVLDV